MLTTNGLAPGELLLDWNESPLGPPSAAVRRVVDAAHHLHEYPRGLMEEVTALAAGYLSLPASHLLLTSGVDEALDLTMTLADRGWAVTPGFDFHARVVACDKPFHDIPLGSDWQPAAFPEKLGVRDAVFIAQPGNPTGNLIEPSWIDKFQATAGYFFRDETYQEFCSVPSILASGLNDDRTLVYRSFAKAFGLAGIRVGCLIARPELIDRLAPFRRFMPIDAVSLHAAAGVLEEPGFITTLASHVLRLRPLLVAVLKDSGLFVDVRDTETNFVIARVGPGQADAFVAALADHRIRVKSCDYFGLHDWIRIGVGTEDGLRRLADTLDQIRGERATRLDTDSASGESQ
ncbi:MAG TPA: histidinol-phosphate transaminase [Mycobacteriales bacterium]